MKRQCTLVLLSHLKRLNFCDLQRWIKYYRLRWDWIRALIAKSFVTPYHFQLSVTCLAKNTITKNNIFQALYNWFNKKDYFPKMHVSSRLSVHCWGSECFDSLSAFGPGGRKSNNKSAGAPHNNTHTQLQTVDSTLLILSNSSGTHALDIWDKPGHFSRALPDKSSTVPWPLMPHTFSEPFCCGGGVSVTCTNTCFSFA